MKHTKGKLEIDGVFLCITDENDGDYADYICMMDPSLGDKEQRANAKHLVEVWNGYDWAIKRAQDLAKENVALIETLKSACVTIKFMSVPQLDNNVASDKELLGVMTDSFEEAIKMATESTPPPAEPQ